MTQAGGTALVFPPLWYYSSVPADLLYTGSYLVGRGVPVRCFDLNAGLFAELLRDDPGYQALRRPETYGDAAAGRAATQEVLTALSRIADRHRVRFDFLRLQFPDVDEAHVPCAREVGLDASRNPALAYLRRMVPQILADSPRLLAVALGHPDQLTQILALGRLLRDARYDGCLVIFGSHEDVLTPRDLVDDLCGMPRHLLFEDYDAVIIGEAEPALLALWDALHGKREKQSLPNLIAPAWGLVAPPLPGSQDLRELLPPDFSLFDGSLYSYPEPLVDLRVSRGCAWGRCTFCAITLHQEGYRTRPVSAVIADMEAAHRALGTRFFRLRDDLLTPKQLRELGRLVPQMSFQPRFSARARFEPNLSRDVLQAAAEAGLEELWLGLESASERVRNLMLKGAPQAVVERILIDASELGIAVRALCIIGHPGETAAEVRGTFSFLQRHIFRLSSFALTPFLLMPGTPLAKAPASHGLTLLPDPLPRHERLRSRLRAAGPSLLSEDQRQDRFREGTELLAGWLRPNLYGPTLSHSFVHSSVKRRGWPR
jgi:hypothetical protein